MPYILLCNTKNIVPIRAFFVLIFLFSFYVKFQREIQVERNGGDKSGEIKSINYFVEKGEERDSFFIQKNIYIYIPTEN